MFDVLDRPEHKAANWVFIWLNVIGLLLSIAGAGAALVAVIVARMEGGSYGTLGVGLGVGVCSVPLGLVLLGLAQCIRYLAAIASKP